MLDVPLVGDLVGERVETFNLVLHVRMSWTVRHDGHLVADAFEAVPHQRRHGHETVVLLAHEDFLHLAARGRIWAIIMQHELDHAMHHRVVQRHHLVNMPGLDRAGIDAGEVDLAELLEVRRIAAQHVHDFATLVGNLAERSDDDAVDHGEEG